MVVTYFLPRYLLWISWKWPFVHVRKGRRVAYKAGRTHEADRA